jgi:hypothetical protein
MGWLHPYMPLDPDHGAKNDHYLAEGRRPSYIAIHAGRLVLKDAVPLRRRVWGSLGVMAYPILGHFEPPRDCRRLWPAPGFVEANNWTPLP